MKMELKSYPKYLKHVEKMDSKVDKLKEQIEKREAVVAELRQGYAVLFAEDEDTSSIAKKLAKAEDELNGLKRELSIIESSNLKPKQLAHEVWEQYQALMAEVEAERSRLWQEADRIKQEARDKVDELNQRRNDLAARFNLEIGHEQFRHVISDLDVSEDRKHSLSLGLENGPIRGYIMIPELKIK